MRRLTLAITLACVLSGVAHAGEIHPTGATAPAAPGSVRTTDTIPSTGATIGKTQTTGETAPEESETVLTIILTLISIVP